MRQRFPLIGLFLAEGISLAGSRLSMIALPWLVLVSTGSAASTGIVAAAEMLPYVLAGAFGAPLIDRIGARRASIAADLLSAVVVAAIPFAYHSGLGVIVTLVAVAGLLRGAGDIAKRVMLPAAVHASGTDMTRATGLYDGIGRLSALIAATGAGALIVLFSAPTVIIIDAVSFAVCAAIIAVARTGGAAPNESTSHGQAPEQAGREPYLTVLRDGAAYLVRDRLILAIVAMMFAINLFDQACLAVFIPVWAQDVIGSPVAIGLTAGAFAFGAVVGNIAFTWLAPRLPRYLTFTLGFLIAGAPRLFALGFSDSVAVVSAFMFLAGVGISAANPIIAAVMYERIPPQFHARVFGIATAAAFAGMPFGSLLGGWGAEALGLTSALVLAGGLYLATTLVPVVGHRTWRQMQSRPSAPDGGVPQVARPIDSGRSDLTSDSARTQDPAD